MRLGCINRAARRDHTSQDGLVHRRDPARAQGAQQGEEARVFLPEHVFQRQQGKFGLLEGGGIEEIAAAIALLQDRRLTVGNDRRQLVQVARKDHPHAAERTLRHAVEFQAAVNRVQHVRAHHRNLVDDHGFHGLDQAGRAQPLDIGRFDQARRQLEEGMDRLAAGIHRRHTCRCEDDSFFTGFCKEPAQHRRLAGARASGEEQVALGPGAGGHPFGGRGIEGFRICSRRLGHVPA